MSLYLLRRVIGSVVLLIAVSMLTFALLYLDSASIARRLLGPSATDEIVTLKTAELGLDQPLPQLYGDWIVSAVTGDLGRSWFTSELVAVSIGARLGVTLSLVIGATLVSAIVAVLLGVLAARRGGWIDATVQFVAVLGFAVPGFLIALYLVLIFAVALTWFNATGYTPPEVSPSGWIASVTLPIIALSFSVIAAVAQQVRGSFLDAMSRDYVRTLWARGIRPRSVIYRHVLRNAAGPGLSVLALQMVGLLGGTVVIEQIFALPGLGQLAVQATTQGDIPVVMGLVVVFAVIVLLINLAVDLAHAALNPKVRLS